MAKPNIEDGYLKIANELAQAFAKYRLTGEQSAIVWCILRLTYGYNKRQAPIQITTFTKMTGLKPPNVIRTIARLKKKGVVTVEDDLNLVRIKKYGIQKNYELWDGFEVITGDNKVITRDNKKEIKELSPVITEIITRDNRSYQGRQLAPIIKKQPKDNLNTTHPATKKKPKSKPQKVDYPPWLDLEMWKEFKRHRSRIKAPMTAFAEVKMINKLKALCNGNMERHREHLEQSITNGWKGVFELREETTESTWKPQHQR